MIYEEFARLANIDIKDIKENIESVPKQEGGRIFYYKSNTKCLLFEINLIGSSLDDVHYLFIYYDGSVIYSANGVLCYRSCRDTVFDELSLSPERKFNKEDEKRISTILDSNRDGHGIIVTTLHRTVKYDFILSPNKKDITILLPVNNNGCNII